MAHLGICLVKHLHHSLGDVCAYGFQGVRYVVDCLVSHLFAKDLAVEGTRLAEIIVRMPWFYFSNHPSNNIWFISGRFVELETVFAIVGGIRFVVRSYLVLHVHVSSVVCVVYFSSVWTIDWNLFEVGTQSVSVGIWVRK